MQHVAPPSRFLLAIIPLLLASCGSQSDTFDTQPTSAESAQPVQWRFALEEPQGSLQDAYAQRFKELVEERSDGRIEVVIYPYGTLGTSDQLTEQLHMNVVQFAMASPGHLGKLIPELQVFLLHFVFSDDPAVNKAVLSESSELRRMLRRLYAEKGLEFLAIFSEGWQVWTTNEPIRRPEDFAGLKMRVMTSPLLLAAYEAYGASPTPLPYGEVYSALQLNMIDGQENPVFAIEEMSFYEVTDWMIFARHAPFVATVATNRRFYESLSDDERRLLAEVTAELNDDILQIERNYNRERLEIIRRRKPELNIITDLTPAQREAFRQASLPVREQFIAMTGPRGAKLLNLLRDAVQRHESRAAAESDESDESDGSDGWQGQ